MRGGGRREEGEMSSCFPFKYMRLFLGFIIQIHQTQTEELQSLVWVGSADCKRELMPCGLCSDTKGKLPDIQ